MVEENKKVLLEVQVKLDDLKDRVADLMSCLLNLRVGEEKVAMPSVAGSFKPLKKRLGSLVSELQSANERMDSLASGPGFNFCLVQHLAENTISRGLLLLEGDYAPQAEWAMRIKESLSSMSFRLKRLQFDQASGISLASASGVTLPMLEVPTFGKNIMNWAAFWE